MFLTYVSNLNNLLIFQDDLVNEIEQICYLHIFLNLQV